MQEGRKVVRCVCVCLPFGFVPRVCPVPAFWNRPRLATVQAPSPPFVLYPPASLPSPSGGRRAVVMEPPGRCREGTLARGRNRRWTRPLLAAAQESWRKVGRRPRCWWGGCQGLAPAKRPSSTPGSCSGSASSHLASRLLPCPRSGSGDRKHSLVAYKPVAGCPPGCDCKIGWFGVLHLAWRGRNWSISGEASGVWRQREVRSLEHCGPGRFPSQRERSQARGFPGRQVRLRPLVSRSFSPPCPAAAAAYPNTLTLPTNPIMDQYLLI